MVQSVSLSLSLSYFAIHCQLSRPLASETRSITYGPGHHSRLDPSELSLPRHPRPVLKGSEHELTESADNRSARFRLAMFFVSGSRTGGGWLDSLLFPFSFSPLSGQIQETNVTRKEIVTLAVRTARPHPMD